MYRDYKFHNVPGFPKAGHLLLYHFLSTVHKELFWYVQFERNEPHIPRLKLRPFPRPIDVHTVGETTSSNIDLGSLKKVIVEREQLTPTADDGPRDLGSSEVDVERVSPDTTADGSELGSSSDGLMLGEMGGVITVMITVQSF